MKVGVDSSVLVAAVHAGHPRHALAVGWLGRAIVRDEVTVCHHSLLEAYAVLTSLPGALRVTPPEARELLVSAARENMEVAPFGSGTIWETLDELVSASVAGGRSYDLFTARALRSAGAVAVATFNPRHFAGTVEGLAVIDPSTPEAAESR